MNIIISISNLCNKLNKIKKNIKKNNYNMNNKYNILKINIIIFKNNHNNRFNN